MFVINAAQTEDVLFGPHGCLAKLNKGAVILCCATVAPEVARGLGPRITEAGFLMLDSPVSGGKAGAQAGTMTVMASGSDAAFAKAQPVLDAISTKVWKLGSEPGVGSTVKMVNQLLAGVHIATAAEALSLGIRAGADPQTLYDVISTSAGSSWMWQNRVPHILEGDDSPVLGGEHLRQGPGDRAGPGPVADLPAADGLGRAPVVPGGGGAWRGDEGQLLRHPGVAGADRDRTAEEVRPRMSFIRCRPVRCRGARGRM